MAKILNRNLKIAIFDLTDCEGCELEFINMRQKLTAILGQTEIANWRFATDSQDEGPFDITFIEGSPMTDKDIEVVKRARTVSRLIVTLGSCAELGGIQSFLDKNEWKGGLKEVYGDDYQSNNRAPKPVSYYIDTDLHLPGCPVNTEQLMDFLAGALVGKKPATKNYPLCLECKANENSCLLLEGQPCLGPVTRGGCNSICVNRGLRCWGCYGLLEGANLESLRNHFVEKFGEKRALQLLKTFFAQDDHFRLIENKVNQQKPEKKVRKLKVLTESSK